MKTFILILCLYNSTYGRSISDNVSVTAVEFSSEQKCMETGEKMIIKHKLHGYYICAEK